MREKRDGSGGRGGGGVCERREMGRAGGVACLGGRLVGRKGARKMGRGSGWVVCNGTRDEGSERVRAREMVSERTSARACKKRESNTHTHTHTHTHAHTHTHTHTRSRVEDEGK